MEDLLRQAQALQQQIADATSRMKLSDTVNEYTALKKQSERSDFWLDNLSAQETMKQIAKLEAKIRPWQELQEAIGEVIELLKLGDVSMQHELAVQINETMSKFMELKEQLKLTGPYDDYDAIVTIYAGAGGTDAQDWAQILERMYLRYAEKQGWKTMLVEESLGDEAGIKSATFEVSGSYAYGKLKGEHGVHRLVRQSPFNSAASRETSFAKVDVLPMIDKPDALEIDDKDLRIDVYRSGGHGGQSVNTTDSAVRITHLPTNIVVAIQNERSQLQNKETAMTILRSRLAQLQLEQHAEKISDLKGSDAANEFGSQIRNYVLHPYKQVKDLRSGYETSDPDAVLDGDLDEIINANLEHVIGSA